MTKSKDLRNVAITHYQNGRNASEISTTLANKVHHVTIHRGIQRFNQSGLVNARKSSGRRRTGRTKRLINLVKRRITSQSTRKCSRTMAMDFETSQSNILRILKQDLKLKCYRKITAQKLEDRQKAHRKKCCIWLKNVLLVNRSTTLCLQMKKSLIEMVTLMLKITAVSKN
ncbi:unnamed protein product [Rotaria magnacalcarata]|uniref:Transposase Tc1-like domain-containing protein n=1 Tax=Rotaria magnacalcarata TaxID=392030 RepID=A0A816BK35_9BILA|nr:unnamed protein product [Rotaria magnacalcarata]CAF1999995.1 unnamed protein product [Rotaria magnacalcarata]